MSWNYRLIRHTDRSVGIHEVYYNSRGRVCAWTANPVRVVGDSAAEVRTDLRLMAAAWKKPILLQAKLPGQSHPIRDP